MKTKPLLLSHLIFAGVALSPCFSRAQETTVPPATGDILLKEVDTEVSVATGSIFSVDAEAVSVTPENSAIPLVFTTTAATPLVDEEEKPVAKDMMRKGIAATVHYTTVGEKLIATKVIVTRETLAGGGAADPGGAARKRAELTEIEGVRKAHAAEGGGTLMGFEQIIAVRLPGETTLTQYTVNSSTLFVDSAGNPVPPHVVRTGVSLSVQFVEDAGRRIATRVTVTSMPAWVREGMIAAEASSPEGAQTESALTETRAGSVTQTSRTQGSNGQLSNGSLADGFIYQPMSSLPSTRVPGQTKGGRPGALHDGRSGNTSQPNANQPNATQPNANQPNATQPNATQPNATQPGTNKPSPNRTTPGTQPGAKSSPSTPSSPSPAPAPAGR